MSFERHMSDNEALMWNLEKDPALSSWFASITILDTVPSVDRLRSRLAVAVADGQDPDEVAAAIDEATDGLTDSLTVEAAIDALPGVSEQRGTFNQIIFVTFAVAGLITALFFAFVTLERSAQYGVLKAIGASSGQIFAGLVVQAVAVTAGAFVLGGLISLGLTQVVPPEVPLVLQPSRALFVAVGMFATALVGGSISLRRVIRIDPASAIS